MTTPPTSSPLTAREDGSSVSIKAPTKAAGGEGAGSTCGTCRYWCRDDQPGVFEAHGDRRNRHGTFEGARRMLTDEPCGWCGFIVEHRERYRLAYDPMLYFASTRACACYESGRQRLWGEGR